MNKIILKGRITKDIDIRYTQSTNIKIANFSIAVRRDYKNQSGEYELDFFNCTAFKNNAEFLEKYFKKGQEILLIGHLQNRNWEDNDGNKHYATDVIVDSTEFCGNRNSDTQNEESDTGAELEKVGIEFNQIDDDNPLPF